MRKPDVPEGIVHTLWLDSEALAGNMLGDPTRRRIDVHIPAGHDGSGLPLLVDLVGYMAGGPAHTNWRGFGENVPERLDRLIGTGAMPPVVTVFPDCYTRLGGNQYIDSIAMGRWETFLVKEMLPLVEERYGCGGAGRRGVFGKSSGGFGTIVQAMRNGGKVWSAAACHSGDMGFELLYTAEFCNTLRALAKRGNDVRAFIEALEKANKPKGDDWHVMMILTQGATFDPDPEAFLGIRLPVDLETCEPIKERWANWLKWDPVRMADKAGNLNALRKLKALFIDCGDVDQYNLVYGARVLHRKLKAADVQHVYEEFPDNHSSTDYRMDVSLPILAKALA